MYSWTYPFPLIEVPLGSILLVDPHVLQHIPYCIMLVYCDIACLPIVDERDDRVLDAPHVPDIKGNPGILEKVVDDDEPSFHKIH